MAEQPRRCNYQYLGLVAHDPCPQQPWEANGCCFFHSENPTKSAQDMMQRVREKLARGDKDFAGYVFPAWCDFGGIDFGDYARFDYATFGDYASFISAKFGDYAGFWGATFGNYASFDSATFGENAFFISAEFGDYARFERATFGDGANFLGATFGDHAFFWGAIFGDEADFCIRNPSTRFILQNVTFKGSAYFAGVTQDLSHFEFHNVSLPIAFFRDAIGLDKAEFDAVRWGSRPERPECVVGDEEQAREGGRAEEYEAAERVYREIRRSYLTRKDFTMARLMHYGEMEMRRLKEAAQRREDHQWLNRRWLRWLSHISLTGAYKVVSGYGTRWLNALWTLLVALLLFTAAFSLLGVTVNGDNSWVSHYPWDGLIQSALSLLLHPTDYAQPANGWGWLVAVLAMVAGPVVITTLVFAVREQFRSL